MTQRFEHVTLSTRFMYLQAHVRRAPFPVLQKYF